MIRPEIADILYDKNTESLIELLYTSPRKVAEWFKHHNVSISLDECEKLMLNH